MSYITKRDYIKYCAEVEKIESRLKILKHYSHIEKQEIDMLLFRLDRILHDIKFYKIKLTIVK